MTQHPPKSEPTDSSNMKKNRNSHNKNNVKNEPKPKPKHKNNFILSHYSCIGMTKLNHVEYSKLSGRPTCYGVEKRLFQSPILQNEEFRSILSHNSKNSNNYNNIANTNTNTTKTTTTSTTSTTKSGKTTTTKTKITTIPVKEEEEDESNDNHSMFTDFKKFHKKELACNEQLVVESSSSPSDKKNNPNRLPIPSATILEDEDNTVIETFDYTTIGRSIYSLIEEFPSASAATAATTTASSHDDDNMIITLQPPKCVGGVAHSKHQLDEIHISSYQIGVLKFDKTVYTDNDNISSDDNQKDVASTNNKDKNSETKDEKTLIDFCNNYPPYVLRIASKTGENMTKISNALYTELSDDFPQRMYLSSKRIVGQFGKTTDRLKKTSDDFVKSADDMYRWFQEDDDDDDDFF